jgi:hypothetical protein
MSRKPKSQAIHKAVWISRARTITMLDGYRNYTPLRGEVTPGHRHGPHRAAHLFPFGEGWVARLLRETWKEWQTRCWQQSMRPRLSA